MPKNKAKPATFASRLRELRTAAGITQEELAERAGISKQAISFLENGRREPTWDTVQRLAVAFGRSTEALRA